MASLSVLVESPNQAVKLRDSLLCCGKLLSALGQGAAVLLCPLLCELNLEGFFILKGIGSNINRLTVLANMGKVQVIGLEKAAGELSEVSAALRAVMEGR